MCDKNSDIVFYAEDNKFIEPHYEFPKEPIYTGNLLGFHKVKITKSDFKGFCEQFKDNRDNQNPELAKFINSLCPSEKIVAFAKYYKGCKYCSIYPHKIDKYCDTIKLITDHDKVIEVTLCPRYKQVVYMNN